MSTESLFQAILKAGSKGWDLKRGFLSHSATADSKSKGLFIPQSQEFIHLTQGAKATLGDPEAFNFYQKFLAHMVHISQNCIL